MPKEEKESLSQFRAKIDQAQIEGEEWIETSDEIIKYYNPRGLGNHEGYFIYSGIKCCPRGSMEELKKKASRQLGQALFGDEEGKVNQVVKTRSRADAPVR